MATYATAAEGDTYFALRLNADPWEDATEDNKTRALNQASRIIDRLNFLGTRTEDTQELQFPRDDDTEIPTDIQYACLELCLSLLDDVDPGLEYETMAMTRFKFADAESIYKRDDVPMHIVAGVVSIEAWRFLIPYLRDANEMHVNRV